MKRLLLLAVSLLVLFRLARNTRPPRNIDPRIGHAGWCSWTLAHPEDCDCEQAAGA